jgi:hypothetical protein
MTSFIRRNPTTLLPSPDGLQAGVRRINSGTKRGVGFDAMLAQRVAENRREARNGAIDRRFRQPARQQRSLDVMNVLASNLGNRLILATGQIGIDVWISSVARSSTQALRSPSSAARRLRERRP